MTCSLWPAAGMMQPWEHLVLCNAYLSEVQEKTSCGTRHPSDQLHIL